MGKLLVDLDREALERVRVRLGARSHAEALRKLVEAADAAPTVAMGWRDPEEKPQIIRDLQALVAGPPRIVRVVDDGGPALIPIRMPRAKPGSLLKKR